MSQLNSNSRASRANNAIKIGVAASVFALAIGGGFAVGRYRGEPSHAAPVAAAQSLAIEEALFAKAFELHTAGNLAKAKDTYEKVLSQNKTNKYALYNLGQLAQAQAKNDEAIERYRQSLAVDAKFAAARYNLGLTYAAAGRVEEAIAEMRAAVDLSPGDARPLFELGKLLIVAGQADEGAAAMAQAFAIDPALKPA